MSKHRKSRPPTCCNVLRIQVCNCRHYVSMFDIMLMCTWITDMMSTSCSYVCRLWTWCSTLFASLGRCYPCACARELPWSTRRWGLPKQQTTTLHGGLLLLLLPTIKPVRWRLLFKTSCRRTNIMFNIGHNVDIMSTCISMLTSCCRSTSCWPGVSHVHPCSTLDFMSTSCRCIFSCRPHVEVKHHVDIMLVINIMFH